MPSPLPSPVAVVLCGGTSRRLGVRDKTALEIDGRTMLDHLLDGLPTDWPVIAVGDERAVTRTGVTWLREDPPLGGPLAAVATAVHHVVGSADPSRPVVVIAGDMPYAARPAVRLVDALASADAAVDGVVAVDPEGVDQPLLAAYRLAALAEHLAGDQSNRPARHLLRLSVDRLTVDDRGATDIDTPGDLAASRHRLEP